MEFTVQITDEQMCLLEKAQYEINGLNVLIKQFSGDGAFKIGAEEYKLLLDRYSAKFVEVETLKTEIMRAFVAPLVADGRVFECNFDFVRNTIYVTIG